MKIHKPASIVGFLFCLILVEYRLMSKVHEYMRDKCEHCKPVYDAAMKRKKEERRKCIFS